MTSVRSPLRPTPAPTIPPTCATAAAVERLASLAARLLLEVESGRRPVAQFEALVSPALLERLASAQRRRRRPEEGRSPGPSAETVRCARPFWPTPDACEASVVVDEGDRVSAVAVRIERYRGGWRITEMTRPHEHA